MSTIVLDGHKIAWHRERVEAWLGGERIAPVTIDCALTRSCTYKCVYCYGQLQANEERKMTREVIFRFLDDAAEIGVKAISLISDGESTCSRYFYDAVLHGRDNGLDMAVATNGYLLDDGRLGEILPALTYLRFNMSAAEPLRYSAIHGCTTNAFDKVTGTVRKCVMAKRESGLGVTLGLQMVLLPEFRDQVIPLARLGRELGVDYLVIKHCSDDETGTLGVDYSKYHEMVDILKEAETFSTDKYLVKVKWSKILSDGRRNYSRCYGPPFMFQVSGSGLVAPCGMLFNSKYKKYHIGNIADTSLKDLWRSERYWDIMNFIASDKFNAHTMCGCLCLQHKINEFLRDVRECGAPLREPEGDRPEHINYI